MTSLQIISASAIAKDFPAFPEDLTPYVQLSNPIFAGYHRDQPFCIIGLVPQRTSGVVGIWGWNTHLVHDHPYIYARWAHRLIAKTHTLYPTIIGYCPAPKHRWLRTLGATFSGDNFTIEAPQ
jgi:hypothetical protein